MAQTARASRTRLRRGAAPVLPEDLVVWEILVRLPAKELLRCRAVCRSWRVRTSAADFLLAHHRRQPSLPLVEFLSHPGRRWEVFDAFLGSLDIRRSPAERRPVLRFNDYNHIGSSYLVHASCDGLLLLSLGIGNSRYYICNPIARHWISLPKLRNCSVYGLYPHNSSGEYRILYSYMNSCYVLTVGSSVARGVGNDLVGDLQYVKQCQSVLLHGSLHWIRYVGDNVLVFDTVGESFRWMSVPTYCESNWPLSQLARMDGTLCISRSNECRTMMKLWMLQNYEAEVWQMKYTIKFPVVEMSSIANGISFNGMVLSMNGDVLVYCYDSSCMFHCDNTGKLLQKFQWDGVFSAKPTRQWFKESLVQHAFFQRKDGRVVRKPRFFPVL